jgi:DNA-directed RNA polymerase specialized sigma24 family protein
MTRFAQARPRLLRLACRELGDVGEAEDVVQEAWRDVLTGPGLALRCLSGRRAPAAAPGKCVRHRRHTNLTRSIVARGQHRAP